MSDLILYLVLIPIFLVVAYTFFYNYQKRKLKNNVYKIGKISDNLGNSYYKILAKTKNGKFKEFQNFPISKTNLISSEVKELIIRSWDNLEEAESNFQIFKILIGKIHYKKNITVVD